MTNTPKYRVTLDYDDNETTIIYDLTFAQAVAYAAQYLENRFDDGGIVDAVTYDVNVVQLFKIGVYTYACWVRPQVD